MQACHSASSSSSMLSTAMRRMPHALALPRTRRERPRHRAAEQRDELPASHNAPRGQNLARHRLTVVQVLERGERDMNCDQLFRHGDMRGVSA